MERYVKQKSAKASEHSFLTGAISVRSDAKSFGSTVKTQWFVSANDEAKNAHAENQQVYYKYGYS